MIRWYDYVAAFIVADIIQSLVFTGLNSTIWWEPLLYGGLAGFIVRNWGDLYCQFRLKQEKSRGQ